ncbi:hypothetical protein J6590_013129 [Homalodisca vitripennis]|nr:hypothetical protein J6590_013129 [Homalodisca vitripennis]
MVLKEKDINKEKEAVNKEETECKEDEGWVRVVARGGYVAMRVLHTAIIEGEASPENTKPLLSRIQCRAWCALQRNCTVLKVTRRTCDIEHAGHPVTCLRDGSYGDKRDNDKIPGHAEQ